MPTFNNSKLHKNHKGTEIKEPNYWNAICKSDGQSWICLIRLCMSKALVNHTSRCVCGAIFSVIWLYKGSVLMEDVVPWDSKFDTIIRMWHKVGSVALKQTLRNKKIKFSI